ncbi:hypothetical protein EII19_13475 [Comamonadaceae bacterium OH2310_COT-174]|nr:hypothetical protein EII19_13475 [Comamonadaceae bacterium OH2310_COT-174]
MSNIVKAQCEVRGSPRNWLELAQQTWRMQVRIGMFADKLQSSRAAGLTNCGQASHKQPQSHAQWLRAKLRLWLLSG